MDELASLDATAQAELVKRRAVTPLELVDAAIKRIEHVNPTVNAVVIPLYDMARKAAAGRLPDGPFTGVPFVLKDLVARCEGARLTSAAGVWRDYISDHDSELVRRYKQAGLVMIGKTNTPEFGIPPTTEPRLFGPTRNPWDTSKTPGGSSGGSGAAVASAMVPMAHGNDGGGSIRIPASCCGVFGLKPTRGRNPLGPDYGDMMCGLVAEHALTRSVRDSAALLDATAGPDVGDPYWAPPPVRPFLAEVGAAPGRLRIALSVKTSSDAGVHPDCVNAVRDAAALCAELGHEVVEAMPTIDDPTFMRAYVTLYVASVAHNVAIVERESRRALSADLFEPLTWALSEMGSKLSAADCLRAIEDVQRTARMVARFFVDYDIWLTPVLAQPPFPLGALDAAPGDPLKGFLRAAEICPFTPICNATGQPAMSVPLYWNAAGLPIGSHFVARFGDEATLFRLAAQLEAARPWAKRRPPVSA